MHAGKLRHRITFQEPNRTANAIGEMVEIWQDVCTAWAAIEPLTGRQYFDARQATSEADGKITIRYMNVLDTWRIVWSDPNSGEKVFDIISIIQPQQGGKETQILYKERLD